MVTSVRNPFSIWIMVCMFVGMLMSQAWGGTLVRVVAYPFPPYVNEDHQTGITFEILKLINEAQEKFHFEVVIKEPNARYESLKFAQQDMILFEMPEWSWQDQLDDLQISPLLMKDGEVYIAKRDAGRTFSYFENIRAKHIVAYAGYHYNFAEYNADKKWLEENFDISFAAHHRDILNMVYEGKAQVGIVTVSFLKQYFMKNPDQIHHFLVSQKFAQVYHLKAMIRKEAPISLSKFNELLSDLKNSFKLQELLEREGVLRQWAF